MVFQSAAFLLPHEKLQEQHLNSVLYVVSQVAYLATVILSFMIMLRAIMSWFIADEDNRLYNFLIAATEPFIIPIRSILDRFEVFRQLPVDMSMFFTMLILSIIQLFL